MDDDFDDNDWQSLGAGIFNTGESLLESASEALASDRVKVSGDEVFEGLKNGDVMPSLLFVRDQFPNAAAYLLSAVPLMGAPLFISETERTLEERMSNLGKTNNDASPLDVAAAGVSAVVNVMAERLPFFKPGKALEDAGVLKTSLNAIKRDLAWEAAGGATEETLTKIGTNVDLTAEDIGKAAFLEALGGLGTTGYTVYGQVTQNNERKRVKAALQEKKDSVVSVLEQRLEDAPSRLAKARIKREIKKVNAAKNITKLRIAYPDTDTEAETEEGEGVRDAEGNIVTPVEGGPDTIDVPAFGSDGTIDPSLEDKLPAGVTLKDGRLVIEITGGQRSDTESFADPSVLEDSTPEQDASQDPSVIEDATPDTVSEIARIDAEIDSLMSEGKTGIFSDLLSRPQRDAKVRELQARKAELQKTLGSSQRQTGSATASEGPTILERADADSQQRVEDALEQEQIDSQDTEPSPLFPRIREERLRKAAAERADSRGQPTEEDLELTAEARRMAQERADAKPIIETDLGPTSIKDNDVTIGNARVQAARRKAQGLPPSRVGAEERQDRFESERAANAEQAERDRELEQQDLEASEAERNRTQAEIDARIKEAQERQDKLNILEAEDRAYRFIVPYINPDNQSTIAEIKALSESAAEQIGRDLGPEARKAFRVEFESRLKDLKADRAEDAKAKREAEQEAKAAPAQAEATSTETESNIDIDRLRSEFLRIQAEEGDQAAADYFKREAARATPSGQAREAEANQEAEEKAAPEKPKSKPAKGTRTKSKGAGEQQKAAPKKPEEDVIEVDKDGVAKKKGSDTKKDTTKKDAKPLKQGNTTRLTKWKPKGSGSTNNLNGYPIAIVMESEGKYNAKYKGEEIQDIGSTLQEAEANAFIKFASPEQKEKAKKSKSSDKVKNLEEKLAQAKAEQDIEEKARDIVAKNGNVVTQSVRDAAETLNERKAGTGTIFLKEAERFEALMKPQNAGKFVPRQNGPEARIREIQSQIDNLKGKKVKAQGPTETKPKKSFKYIKDTPLPKIPGMVGRKVRVAAGENKGSYQIYVDGKPIELFSSSSDSASRKLNNLTKEELEKVYRRTEAKANQEKTAGERAASRFARSRDRQADTQSSQEAKVASARNAAEKKLAEANPIAIGNFRRSDIYPKSGNNVNVTPYIRVNSALSEKLGSPGLDVVVQYKNKDVEIIYFSAVDAETANSLVSIIEEQAPLFNEFLQQEVKSRNALLFPTGIKDSGKEQLSLQRSIDRLKEKSQRTKTPLSEKDKATIRDNQKTIERLKKQADIEYNLVMPDNHDKGIENFIKLLEDRGVDSQAFNDVLNPVMYRDEDGNYVGRVPQRFIEDDSNVLIDGTVIEDDGTAPVENTGDNEAEIVKELNQVARGTEDVVYNNKTGDYEYRQDPKKKVVSDDVVAPKDADEKIEFTHPQELEKFSDSFRESYENMLDAWSQNDSMFVVEALNRTVKEGGLSAKDINKIVKDIQSNEGYNFNLPASPSRKDNVDALTEYLNSNLEDGPVEIEDESEYDVSDEDLGWSESRTKNPVKGFDSAEEASNAIVSELNEVFGSKAVRRMIDSGFITIMTLDQARSSSLRYKKLSGETNAFVDAQTAKIVFLVDNIANNTNDVRGLIFHELGVHYGKNILSDSEFSNVLEQVYKLALKSDPVVSAAVDEVLENYSANGDSLFGVRAGPPSLPENSPFWEEVLAHVIQNKAAEIKPSLFDRILSAFSRFFKKALKPLGVEIDTDMDVNDIVNLIAGNIKRVPAHAFRQQRAYNVKDLTVDGTTANGLQYPYLNSKKYQKFLNERKIWESRSKRIIPQVVEATNDSQKGRGLILSAYKGIQKYIEPLMTVDNFRILETQRMLMKGKKEEAHNSARIIGDVLRTASKKEKAELIKFFETPNASPDKLSKKKISYAPFESVLKGSRPGPKNESKMTVREGAIKAKKMIEDLGQQLVEAGALDADQYQSLKGQYLPRVYLKYVMSGQDRIGGGYMAGSMGYIRSRKEEESVLEDIVSGRIKDPGYLASRYIAMAGSDLATINYLNFIASDPSNSGWVLPNQVVQIDGLSGSTFYFKDLAEAMRKRASILRSKGQDADAKRTEDYASRIEKEVAKYPEISNADTKRYRKVPNNVRYGSMRGMYVDKRIWDDLTQQGVITSQNEVLGGILSFLGKFQKTFKYTHVPMQLPAQGRNIASNLFLLNSAGVPVHRIPESVNKAIDNIVNNGKYLQIARKYGIESTTFASEELGSIDRQLALLRKDEKGMEGTISKLKIVMDQFNVFGRAYQKTEVLFKVAKIIDEMERKGLSESEAAMNANEALLDYGNVSPLLRTLRSMPLGSPFITFNAKVLTQLMRNVKNHPVANAKFIAIPYIMSEIMMAQFDELDDEELAALKKFVPEYAENNSNVYFLPYKDQNGKWVAFDMSYFLPWGAYYSIAKNLGEGELGEAFKTTGLLGGPVQGLVSGMQNIDPFTKQPIWNESDPPRQQAQDIMHFMASYMVPPMMMPRGKAGGVPAGGGPAWKSMAAAGLIEGNIGKDGLEKYSGMDAMLSWFGFNTMKIGPYEMQNRVYWKQKEIDDIIKRGWKLLQDPNLSDQDRVDMYEEYRILLQDKYLELEEWMKIASKVPK
jgi:colicin import membrane protein